MDIFPIAKEVFYSLTAIREDDGQKIGPVAIVPENTSRVNWFINIGL